jgi:hypothetical protein
MGGDLPPAVLPSFMLGWGSSQARDVLPKGKRKLGDTKVSTACHLRQLLPCPGKMPAINSLSGTGSCGGNDFWCPSLKEDGLSAEQTKGHWVEKKR